MLPMRLGDVKRTYADTSRLEEKVGYKSKIEIELGIAKFGDCYKTYHGL